jgi:hypothetical protein
LLLFWGVWDLKKLLTITLLPLLLNGCAGSAASTIPATPVSSSGGVTSYLYYYLLAGDGLNYTIVYSLSNYMPETLKVYRVELLDGTGDVKRTVSESSIEASSSGGRIERNGSFKLASQVSKLPVDIKDWIVRWYCTDSSGQSLIIDGKYSIPRN